MSLIASPRRLARPQATDKRAPALLLCGRGSRWPGLCTSTARASEPLPEAMLEVLQGFLHHRRHAIRDRLAAMRGQIEGLADRMRQRVDPDARGVIERLDRVGRQHGEAQTEAHGFENQVDLIGESRLPELLDVLVLGVVGAQQQAGMVRAVGRD